MAEPVTMALIAGGTALAGTGANAYAQGRMNKKTREWNEKMFEKTNTRDLEFWNLQNSYNSPESQMERLRDAGLNPNLVYGNGTSTVASAPSTSSAPSWNPRAPELDIARVGTDSLGAYYDAKTKQAQADNLKAQNDVLLQEAVLKSMQTAQTAASTAKTKQETEQASQLFGISLEAAKANVEKTQADTKYTLDENERRIATTSSGLAEAAERILKSRSDRATSAAERARISVSIRDIANSAELKQLDIELKRKGIGPNDPVYMRALGRAIENIADKGLSGTWQGVKDWFTK